eukprot:1156629-Pelagomonas_calceolata.AAC.1
MHACRLVKLINQVQCNPGECSGGSPNLIHWVGAHSSTSRIPGASRIKADLNFQGPVREATPTQLVLPRKPYPKCKEALGSVVSWIPLPVSCVLDPLEDISLVLWPLHFAKTNTYGMCRNCGAGELLAQDIWAAGGQATSAASRQVAVVGLVVVVGL